MTNNNKRVEELTVSAEALADAGQLLDARSLYGELCKLKPGDEDVWFMDGSLSLDLGDTERAETSIDKALALNPSHPEALYVRASLAQVQGDLYTARDVVLRCIAADSDYAEAWCLLASLQGATGRYSDAVGSSARATSLDPMMADAFLIKSRALQALDRFPEAIEACHATIRISLERVDILSAAGRILLDLGRFRDAQAVFNNALKLAPGLAAVHEGLGMACLRLAQIDAAEFHLQKALELEPELPDVHRSLGFLLRGKGDLCGALQQYQLALSLNREDLESLVRVSMLYWELGEIPEAVSCCLEVFDKDPDNFTMRQVFPQMLRAMTYPPGMLVRIREELIQTFSVAGIDYEGLFSPALRFLRTNPEIQDIIQSLDTGDSVQAERSILQGNVSHLLHDTLFLQVLCKTTVCDLALENALANVRGACLSLIARGEVAHTLVANSYIFPASLAYQCFHGEYLYVVDADQVQQLEALEKTITAGIQSTESPEPLLILCVIVYAMYRPLHTHESIDLVYACLSKCGSHGLNMILKQQVDDIRRERKLRGSIHALTKINAEFSKAVEAEYDASPYPRWLSAGGYAPEPWRSVFRRRYPKFEDPGFDVHPLKILVAGCGTGRHAVLAASRFANAQVLAVDLSAASLAYAERMVEEMGVDNISFQQADIMELRTTTEQFHVIEAGGVLHNLKDPYQALEILSDKLEDKGLLYVSTYRKSARQPVLKAREFIRQKGRDKTPDGIRQARLDVIAASGDSPAFKSISQWRDFFTLSESRFLLFDVPEHTFELDDIYALLGSSGLRMLGFELKNPQELQRYRALNPDDPAVSDHSKARAFEKDHPSAFSGQYRFWCQKM